MKPVTFLEANLTFAENQPEYIPLPANRSKNGIVTTCWELEDWEVKEITKSRKIWFQQLTFNQPLQPQLPLVKKPILEE